MNFEDAASLEDILHKVTFGPTIYPGRHCDKCNRCLDSRNVARLVTGPDILVILLVRFTNWDGSGSTKNHAVIPFGEELNLSPYTHRKVPLKYHLLSVVQHSGSRECGHYITIAKDQCGQWEELDDETADYAIGKDPYCPRDNAGSRNQNYPRHDVGSRDDAGSNNDADSSDSIDVIDDIDSRDDADSRNDADSKQDADSRDDADSKQDADSRDDAGSKNDADSSDYTNASYQTSNDGAEFTPYILFWARVDENVAAE